ncbi:MAG: polysaccharide deacetylase family protein, partial [Lachnospiraceae bacterium]|nr:polysaccharide deacetylase family protein [Lachnospiraceae bacterium]
MNDFKDVVKWLLTTKVFWAGVIAFALLYAMFWQGRDEVVPTSVAMSNKKIPIYCVDSKEKVVALSFDAAWGNEDTEKILDILKENDVKVTFFMTGEWVAKYPEDVKKIAKDGHALGNHSENHKKMSEISADECKEEIMAVHNKVKELTSIEMEVFRPPYGDYDDKLVDVTYEVGYYPIQWSIDSLDWKNYGVNSIIDTVVNHKALDNGGIILMHNGSKYTADALQGVID